MKFCTPYSQRRLVFEADERAKRIQWDVFATSFPESKPVLPYPTKWMTHCYGEGVFWYLTWSTGLSSSPFLQYARNIVNNITFYCQVKCDINPSSQRELPHGFEPQSPDYKSGIITNYTIRAKRNYFFYYRQHHLFPIPLNILGTMLTYNSLKLLIFPRALHQCHKPSKYPILKILTFSASIAPVDSVPMDL